MYQGATTKLVPFLQSVDLACPMYHNPADFSEYSIFDKFFLGETLSVCYVVKIQVSVINNVCNSV